MATNQTAGVAASSLRDAALEIDIDRGMIRLHADYDPALVDRVRALPGRRYQPESSEWVLPARREGLAAVAALVAELGLRAPPTARAQRRLRRGGPGRIDIHAGTIEVAVSPAPRRLAQIRAIPERRYLADRKRWLVPDTRAAALALLALIDQGNLVASPEAETRLRRLAEPRAAAAEKTDTMRDADDGRRRLSPTPHWRHITRGPIFAANPHRHEWVDGVGWCVRIRVDPDRGRTR